MSCDGPQVCSVKPQSLRKAITYRPSYFATPALKISVASYGTSAAFRTGLPGCFVMTSAGDFLMTRPPAGAEPP